MAWKKSFRKIFYLYHIYTIYKPRVLDARTHAKIRIDLSTDGHIYNYTVYGNSFFKYTHTETHTEADKSNIEFLTQILWKMYQLWQLTHTQCPGLAHLQWHIFHGILVKMPVSAYPQVYSIWQFEGIFYFIVNCLE